MDVTKQPGEEREGLFHLQLSGGTPSIPEGRWGDSRQDRGGMLLTCVLPMPAQLLSYSTRMTVQRGHCHSQLGPPRQRLVRRCTTGLPTVHRGPSLRGSMGFPKASLVGAIFSLEVPPPR